MNKIKLLAVIACVASCLNCAHLKKKQAPQALVQHRSSTVRFIGYKLAVRTKASPQEVEEYLLNPANIEAKAGAYEFKMVSQNKLEKLGDDASFKFEVAGLSFPLKFTMVYRKPGEEIWWLGQADIGVMGFLRFKYKEMEGGTRLDLTYENEDPDTFVGGLTEAINLQEAIVRLLEVEIAKGQEYFDPSMKVEELLEKGLRGQFYDSFFQTYEASIRINASPKKVSEYLYDPQTRLILKEKYGLDFGSCFFTGEPGPCPAKLKVMGLEYDFDCFPAAHNYGKNISAYWVSRLLIARVNMSIKPEKGGSRLTMAYEMELPSRISQEGGSLLMSVMAVPDYLEKDLIVIKNDLEGMN